MRKVVALFLILIAQNYLTAQKTTVRGNVYDKEDGNTIISAIVHIEKTDDLTITDDDGFFTLQSPPTGKQIITITFIGYDTLHTEIDIKPNVSNYFKFYLEPSIRQLNEVQIISSATTKRTEVQAGVIRVNPKQIKALPSIGGESDIAQYLPILPGIVTTGDQGGQIYIRGGSPVQNKIMIDGMTIFNPFHSIGLFSVFETEAIKTVDVLSAGFNVEHGGRMSAVVDIQTRDGNKKNLEGVVGLNPFAGKLLLGGPIIKLREESQVAGSFLLTAKKSLLEYTSKSLYNYVSDEGLPFDFEDYYGKINFSLGNGSKIDLFGFSYNDFVNYTNSTNFNWKNLGGGMNFTLNPTGSNYTLNGHLNYTQYDILLNEANQFPRSSYLNNYNVGVNIVNYAEKSQLEFGVEINGNTTQLEFTNFQKFIINPKSNTTELAFYVKDKLLLGNLVLEPGLRLQYYVSLGAFSPEPRLGLKYNISPTVRFKASGGLYSQNLLSTVDDRDVVNLFNGFLTGPEQSVYDFGTQSFKNNTLQKAIHAVAGVEVDVTSSLEVNIEPYYKKFIDIINLNRSKSLTTDPDYIVEQGRAFGIDLSAKYSKDRVYLWATYSYGNVRRNDGLQEYPTIYDRTHNINLLANYAFGKNKSWEASARFNFGSGFPFTRAVGFYDQIPNTELETDYVSSNGQIGVVYESLRNRGRLPDFHRLDLSLKKTIKFTRRSKLELNASVTNAYNRDNIFYFNRISYERVNQLPILPSAGLIFYF